MKCKKCSCNYTKSIFEITNDLFSAHRGLFLCFDCNENNVWRNTHIPSYGSINYYDFRECVVTSLNYNIKDFIDNIIKDHKQMCRLLYKDGSEQRIFPIAFNNDYIEAYGDAWYEGLKDKPHAPTTEQLKIPIYKVAKMFSESIYLDYYESDPPIPMYGYKAMQVENNIISGGYQIGVMKEVPRLSNPYSIDYQDCYLHYCEKIEEPLLFWNRDYISDSFNDPIYASYHLYKVKAEGHYRKNTIHGWVANKLTLIEEVDKVSIIAYFEENPSLLQELIAYWKKTGEPDDLWEKYKESVQKQ